MVFYNLSYTFKKIALIFLLAPVVQDLHAKQDPVTIHDLLRDTIPPGVRVEEDTEEPVSLPTGYKPLTLRNVPSPVVKELKSRQEFEYANDPAYWSREEEEKETTKSQFSLSWVDKLLQIVIFGVGGIGLIYVFYLIVVGNGMHLFYKSSSGKKGREQASEIEDENLDDKIRMAVNAADYRSAIRYMYLKSLKMLDEKGWIRFNAQSTNYDYVNAVNKYPPGESFRALTRNYEYVWYGEFELNGDHFRFLGNKFEQFYESIKRSGK